MITFKFNEIKTTQVVTLFLRKSGGNMNYMKLIKLLYLVDREALMLWERPLTGDTYVSMPKGPVLSNVLDIINNGENPKDNSYWYKYITTPSDFEIKLKRELIEQDALSKRELKLIEEIFEQFKEFDQWEMVEICHEMLPEWEEVENTSKPIKIERILKEVNKSKDEIDAIAEEISNLNYVKKILSIDD